MSVLKGNFILKQLFLNFNTLYIKTGINYDTRSFQKFKSNMLSTKTLSIFYITSFYISIEFNETKQKFLNLLCITLKLRAFLFNDWTNSFQAIVPWRIFIPFFLCIFWNFFSIIFTIHIFNHFYFIWMI